MSKKKNDQNFISELLGKLKASYSEPEKKTESKKTTSKSESDDLEFQKQLEAMLRQRITFKELYTHYVGPVIGAHSGPGTMAIFFYGSQR